MKRLALITLGLMLALLAVSKLGAPLLPDLGQIAFSQTSDQPQDIYLLDLRTAAAHNLTRTPETAEMMPVWSADGRRLAYTLSGADTVHVVDFSRDGLPVTDLDQGALAEFYPGPVPGSMMPPLSLAYQSRQYFARERMELATYSGDISYQPTYAPDRQRIAYIGIDRIFRPGVLRLADLASDSVTTLSPDGYVFQFPAWSPNGRWLAAQHDHDAVSDLVILDLTCLPDCASAMHVLVRDVGEASSPDWSADGARIAYSCQIARGTAAICIYDLVSGESRGITSPTFGARDLEPAWRPGSGQP